MNHFVKRLAIPMFAVLLGPLAVSARAASGPRDQPFGAPAQAAYATRTLVISPETRHVSVEQGETVRLEVAGQVLLWQFDTLTTNSFDLAAIVPGLVQPGQVWVHVSENPIYRN